MTIATEISALLEVELAKVDDRRVVDHIRSLQIPPRPEWRGWDYGEPGEQFECWFALWDEGKGTGIAYCEQGFGPRCPWGLMFIGDDPERRSMGMDSGWFSTFMDAFFDSFSATTLPIWRAFEFEPGMHNMRPLSAEMGWREAWDRVECLRQERPEGHFMAHHSIVYESADPVLGNGFRP